jgi:hypothetical protein
MVTLKTRKKKKMMERKLENARARRVDTRFDTSM